MVEISLTGKHGRGKVAKVSDEDYEFVLQWPWRVHRNQAGYEYVSRYEERKDGQATISMAREVLARKLGRSLTSMERADHVSRDTLDNRRENLRLASCSENGANSKLKRNNTSGYRGVSYFPSKKKWRAYIKFRWKRMSLGYYFTKEDAARAYDRAAVELFGEFAVLNFTQATACADGY